MAYTSLTPPMSHQFFSKEGPMDEHYTTPIPQPPEPGTSDPQERCADTREGSPVPGTSATVSDDELPNNSRPKILLIDAGNEVEQALSAVGVQAASGSFGIPWKMPTVGAMA